MSDREKKGAFPTREDWERANRVDAPKVEDNWGKGVLWTLEWYQRSVSVLEQELESTKKELERTKDELNSNLCKFSLTQKELDWHKSLGADTRAKYKSRLDMTQEELHTTKEELDMTKQELHKIQEEMSPTLALASANLEWAINMLRVNEYLARSSEDDEGRGEG